MVVSMNEGGPLLSGFGGAEWKQLFCIAKAWQEFFVIINVQVLLHVFVVHCFFLKCFFSFLSALLRLWLVLIHRLQSVAETGKRRTHE